MGVALTPLLFVRKQTLSLYTMSQSTPPPSCPMHQPSEPEPKKVNPPAECPMHQKEKKPAPPPECPMHQTPVTDKINELNMMPSQLGHERQPDQQIDLPTERVISSIPRADKESRWEYPSPQQFYNALRRKGWETPEEHVETMVDIHNFLNEEAWDQVLKWESNFEWYEYSSKGMDCTLV